MLSRSVCLAFDLGKTLYEYGTKITPDFTTVHSLTFEGFMLFRVDFRKSEAVYEKRKLLSGV